MIHGQEGMKGWDPKQILDATGGARQERKRSARIADVIRNEFAVLLLQKVRDPNIREVSVSRVEVSDDLKYAKIYYTLAGGDHTLRKTEKGLERAKGFFRSHLAKTLNLRYTPKLHFFHDTQAERVEEVERILQEIANEKRNNEDS